MKKINFLLLMVIGLITVSMFSFADVETPIGYISGGYNATITQNRSDEHLFKANEYYFSIEFYNRTGKYISFSITGAGNGSVGFGGEQQKAICPSKYGEKSDINWRLLFCSDNDNFKGTLELTESGSRVSVPITDIDLRTDSNDKHKHYMNFTTYSGNTSRYNFTVLKGTNNIRIFVSLRDNCEEDITN